MNRKILKAFCSELCSGKKKAVWKRQAGKGSLIPVSHLEKFL